MNDRLPKELTAVLGESAGFGRKDFFDVEIKHHAAVLALFRGASFIESEILLILRSPDLVQNPGQVALPGGALESEDEGDPIRAALRETFEEVGLDSSQLQALGLLPELPTVTGQFLVHPVVGVWMGSDRPELKLQITEVSHAEWVPIRALLQSRETEKRMVRGVEIELPVFHWKENRMWGLTAMIFDLICRRYDTILK